MCVPRRREEEADRNRSGGWRPGGRRRRSHRRHHGANDMDPQTIERAIKRCIDISVRLGALEDEVPPRPAASSSSAWMTSTKCSDGSKGASEVADGWPGGRFCRRAAPEPSPRSQIRRWLIAPVGTEHHDRPVRSLWVKSVPQARAPGSALMKRRGGEVRGCQAALVQAIGETV